MYVCSPPTGALAILEPLGPEIGDCYVAPGSGLTDCNAQNLWKGRSGPTTTKSFSLLLAHH